MYKFSDTKLIVVLWGVFVFTKKLSHNCKFCCFSHLMETTDERKIGNKKEKSDVYVCFSGMDLNYPPGALDLNCPATATGNEASYVLTLTSQTTNSLNHIQPILVVQMLTSLEIMSTSTCIQIN